MFFRACYAVRMLTNSKGMPTNAIYGFLSMSVKLLKDVKPDYMVYCYDQPGPSFRKDIDENYKANRGETPEELIPQIPYIKQLTELLGIPGIGKEKYEVGDAQKCDFPFVERVFTVFESPFKSYKLFLLFAHSQMVISAA